MPITSPRVPGVPGLPAWTSTPDDAPGAIAHIKAAIRHRLATSGRSIDEVFRAMADRVGAQVDDIAGELEQGKCAWPVIDYADIASGTVSPETVVLLKRRGCMIVRNHFERRQALDWDLGIEEYVGRNRFFENYRGAGDDFFGSVESKPEIYPIYWSPAQIEARQSERMANVQGFLNRLWTSTADDLRWFDPDRDAMYPDRIRRRPPGTTSRGLRTHMDAGTLDLWMTRESQQAFHHLFDGTVEEFDPWSAAHRTTGPQFVGTTMTSAFRTFQGFVRQRLGALAARGEDEDGSEVFRKRLGDEARPVAAHFGGDMEVETVRVNLFERHGPVLVADEQRLAAEAREPLHDVLRIGDAAGKKQELRLRRGEREGEFVIQPAIRVREHLVFVHDQQRRAVARDEPVLLGLQRGHHDRCAQILREIAGGDADVPAARAPLGELVVGERARGHGVDGLAAILPAVGPQFEDERLAGAGRRLHDDVLAFAQGRHGFLLPQVGHRDLVEGGKLIELLADGLHAEKIA